MFFALARATDAPGLGAQAKATLEGLWGRDSGAIKQTLLPPGNIAACSYKTSPRAAALWAARSFFYFFPAPHALPLCANPECGAEKKYLSRETYLYDPTSGHNFSEHHIPALPTVGSTQFRRERRDKAPNHHGGTLRSTACITPPTHRLHGCIDDGDYVR